MKIILKIKENSKGNLMIKQLVKSCVCVYLSWVSNILNRTKTNSDCGCHFDAPIWRERNL